MRHMQRPTKGTTSPITERETRYLLRHLYQSLLLVLVLLVLLIKIKTFRYFARPTTDDFSYSFAIFYSWVLRNLKISSENLILCPVSGKSIKPPLYQEILLELPADVICTRDQKNEYTQTLHWCSQFGWNWTVSDIFF